MSADLPLSPTSVRYFITTDVDPGIISRVLEYFVIRDVIPDLLKVSRYRQPSLSQENLSFDIHLSGLSTTEYEVVLQKITSLVGVQNARMENFFKLNSRNKHLKSNVCPMKSHTGAQ